jgi:hypothetical protein
MNAMPLSSMYPTTNAVGIVNRSTAVAATTKRTSGRFAPRKSTIPFPKSITTRRSPSPSRRRIGTNVKMILPARVSRPHVRAAAVTYPLRP